MPARDHPADNLAERAVAAAAQHARILAGVALRIVRCIARVRGHVHRRIATLRAQRLDDGRQRHHGRTVPRYGVQNQQCALVGHGSVHLAEK